MVRSRVLDLLSRYSGLVGGLAQSNARASSSDMLSRQGKQHSQTPVKIKARLNGQIKSYGPFKPVLWSSEWSGPTICFKLVIIKHALVKELLILQVQNDDIKP